MGTCRYIGLAEGGSNSANVLTLEKLEIAAKKLGPPPKNHLLLLGPDAIRGIAAEIGQPLFRGMRFGGNTIRFLPQGVKPPYEDGQELIMGIEERVWRPPWRVGNG